MRLLPKELTQVACDAGSQHCVPFLGCLPPNLLLYSSPSHFFFVNSSFDIASYRNLFWAWWVQGPLPPPTLGSKRVHLPTVLLEGMVGWGWEGVCPASSVATTTNMAFKHYSICFLNGTLIFPTLLSSTQGQGQRPWMFFFALHWLALWEALRVCHHFISEADRNEAVNFIFGTSFAIKWMVMPWLWLN